METLRLRRELVLLAFIGPQAGCRGPFTLSQEEPTRHLAADPGRAFRRTQPWVGGEFGQTDLTEALLRSACFGRTKLFEERNAIPLLIEFNFIHEGLNQKQASATDAFKIRRIRRIGQ